MTPIDWKLIASDVEWTGSGSGHHSLVTPIDWKLVTTCRHRVLSLLASPLAGDTY